MNPKQKFIKNQIGLSGNLSGTQQVNTSLLKPSTTSNVLSGYSIKTPSVSTGINQGNTSLMTKPVPSNTGATNTAPTKIAPPAKLPPAGQQFVQGLAGTKPEAPLNPYNPTEGIRPPETPTTPASSAPSQKDTYIEAYKSYIDSLRESADVKEAKQAYNDYVANVAKSKAGLEGQGRGIPLGIVRGQQEKLLGQTQPEALRLQGEIDIAQGTQKATQDSLKAGLDLEGKLLDNNKPIEVGGQLYQKQADGTYKSVAGTPKADTLPASAQEYEYAKKQGYTGTFEEYQNEDANRKKSIAAAGVGGTGLDNKQYSALNQITTKFQADPIINQSVKGGTAAMIADQIIANPNSATSQLKSLYVLVKNLDPDSAVREGELALANQTQSYFQQFANTLARITEGRVISPQAAKDLAVATKELMGAWDATAQKRQKQYNSQANTLGIGNEFGSYIQGSELGYNQQQNQPYTASKFDYLQKDITTEGNKAYLPRSIWSTLSGADMDALLAEAKADGFTLLIK